jgi:hypothetical protein
MADVKYSLSAYVDGESVFHQTYPDSVDLIKDLGSAERAVDIRLTSMDMDDKSYGG